ncbi:hypothetical protein CP1MG86_MNBNLCLN_01556 [Companilactobacillus paralimentarius]
MPSKRLCRLEGIMYAFDRNTSSHTVSLLKEVIKWMYEVKIIKRIRPKEGPNSLYFL